MPDLSVVVVVYNIPREAERALYSLSAAYQQHIAPDAYEVIVVDNGSTPPFDRAILDRLKGHFHLVRVRQRHGIPEDIQRIDWTGVLLAARSVTYWR